MYLFYNKMSFPCYNLSFLQKASIAKTTKKQRQILDIMDRLLVFKQITIRHIKHTTICQEVL